MATDPLKRAVAYSTANGNTGLPLSLPILGDKYNEESFGPDNRPLRFHSIPVIKQWLPPEGSYCTVHAVAPSSSQQRSPTVQGGDWEGAALVCLLLVNGAYHVIHAHCHDLCLSTTLALVWAYRTSTSSLHSVLRKASEKCSNKSLD